MFLGIYAVLLLIGLYIIFLRIEKINHERRVRSIPIRIWVNGSRGKSSVTRLIAAGLRGGGKKVIAKTTGTKASFIHDSHSEQPVTRLGMPNIREQVEIFKKAANERPDAIVLECMALRPDLQYSEALHIVKPNAVVITNVRADHLDVMGPSIKDIGRHFLEALPNEAAVFLGHRNIMLGQEPILKKKSIAPHISDEKRISPSQLGEFPYIEHRDNLAIALDVCRYFGVDEEHALAAMYDANPDPGVLRRHRVQLGIKEITLVNAMAANDPDSTYMIWQMIEKNYPQLNILINCRDDRIDRSFQMAELIRDRLRGDQYILTGHGTEVLARRLSRIIEQDKILDVGNMPPSDVIEKISGFVADNSLLFAIGNTVGYGEELIHDFTRKERR
ncbi:MAG: poly-gamma-glutamate synthase PgsB [candidate division WOR-3 bacterium]|nr:MAG: poly-gamma-glutamate synthase PgsB [candidate division WOR-3 bacterium]